MSKGGTGSGLADIGTITAILVPLLYTAGWSFAYHYFDRFHLGLLGLEIPKEYFFLYGFQAIRNQILLSLAALFVLIVIWFLAGFCFQEEKAVKKSRKRKENAQTSKDAQSFRKTVGMVLTPVLVLSLFTLVYYLGDRTADAVYEKQVSGDFPSYPRVKVWLAEDAKKEAGPIAGEWARGCYRLLLRNKDHLYIFYPGGAGDKMPTEVIPTGKVQWVRVLPQYHSCKE